MAFGTTAAGTITKEQTLLSIRRIGVAASTTITKGEVVVQDAGGDLITATTTQGTGPFYVALETVDNSAGADGDLQCPVAVNGHYVTVVAGGAITPGDFVQQDSTVPGRVETWDELTVGQQVGIYFGKEGGTIAKGATTPYLESYTDGADFIPTDAADGDVIEVLLVN